MPHKCVTNGSLGFYSLSYLFIRTAYSWKCIDESIQFDGWKFISKKVEKYKFSRKVTLRNFLEDRNSIFSTVLEIKRYFRIFTINQFKFHDVKMTFIDLFHLNRFQIGPKTSTTRELAPRFLNSCFLFDLWANYNSQKSKMVRYMNWCYV